MEPLWIVAVVTLVGATAVTVVAARLVARALAGLAAELTEWRAAAAELSEVGAELARVRDRATATATAMPSVPARPRLPSRRRGASGAIRRFRPRR